jgi:hypothetical protein
MSIDWLMELERALENGKDVFACPSVGRSSWQVSKSVDELRKVAQKAADMKKISVNIVRLVPKQDATAGDLFLVPTGIDESGPRGEPNIRWSTVETREAAEMMRDVRHGPCPFFAMQVEEVIESTKAV